MENEVDVDALYYVVIANALTIICFTVLSIWFDNPWLVLLALFFFQSYEKTKTITPKKDIKKEDENNG